MFVVANVNQLGADRYVTAALHNPSRQNCSYAQLFPRHEWVGLFPLVAEDRAAGDHFETGQLSQAVDDAFGQAIGEIFRIVIVILIDEWQHGD